MISDSVRSGILTVSEYASRLGLALRAVGPAVLEGEVQRVTGSGRGMLYFDLTDGESVLSCKVFARDVARLEHPPRTGDLVQVRVDRPDLYPARGSLSLIVSAVRLAGEGELLRRRAELLARLGAEGLCDPRRRRPLPRFPRAVGVIAGRESDGMSDVLRALQDRWPAVRIITCPSLVQGKAAPRDLIDALACLQEHPDVEVIVMARGGGSVQDLAPFDDEGLCRALFACAVPVVCAIGHTDNNPVCNHVGWAAFTPSRSAEMVVPSAAELRRGIAVARGELDRVPAQLGRVRERAAATARPMQAAGLISARLDAVRAQSARLSTQLSEFLAAHDRVLARARGSLEAVPHRAGHTLSAEREVILRAGAELTRADAHLIWLRGHMGELSGELGRGVRRQLEHAAGLMAHRAELVAAHDFRRQGWLLAETADGRPLHSVTQITAGARLRLQLDDGVADAVVTDLHDEKDVLS